LPESKNICIFLLCGKILRAMITRYLEKEIRKNLDQKMVFL